MELDFTGVEEAKGKPMTAPGTIGVFTIGEVKFGESKEKKTAYMEVTFNGEDGSSFRHSFYLSNRARPRIQHLVSQVTGKELEKTTSQALIAMLTGKKVGLKVTGSVSNTGKGYPDLPFGSFACPPGDQEVELSFTNLEKVSIDNALKAIEASRVENADKEAAAPAVQDDKF